MNTTVKEIAARFNVDTLAAQKLLDFLRAAGLAQITGTVEKTEGQKGKAPNVWQVPHTLSLDFSTGSHTKIAADGSSETTMRQAA